MSKQLHLSTGLQFPDNMDSKCIDKTQRNYYMMPFCIICILVMIGLFFALANIDKLNKFLSSENLETARTLVGSLLGLTLVTTIIAIVYTIYLNIAINICTTASCIPPYATPATEQYCLNFIADKAASQIANRNAQMYRGVPPGGIRLF